MTGLDCTHCGAPGAVAAADVVDEFERPPCPACRGLGHRGRWGACPICLQERAARGVRLPLILRVPEEFAP